MLILPLERALRRYNWGLPLLCDILVTGVFLYISPELLPALVSAVFHRVRGGVPVETCDFHAPCVRVVAAGLALSMHRVRRERQRRTCCTRFSFFAASFLGAAGMAFLGDRNRRFAWQQSFLTRLANTMHVDLGLSESLRLLLEECAGIPDRRGAAGIPGR